MKISPNSRSRASICSVVSVTNRSCFFVICLVRPLFVLYFFLQFVQLNSPDLFSDDVSSSTAVVMSSPSGVSSSGKSKITFLPAHNRLQPPLCCCVQFVVVHSE